jgi:cell filamentation protein
MAAKYDTSAGIEGEFEPGSKGAVLKNLKGITTKAAMDEQEILSLVEAQEHYLDRIDTETEFTAELICQMHHDWLGEILLWAGQYRTVEMSMNAITVLWLLSSARPWQERLMHDSFSNALPRKPKSRKHEPSVGHRFDLNSWPLDSGWMCVN